METRQQKKITFLLKSEDKPIYVKDIFLEGYHADAIRARDLSFYYFFKDQALELEEKLEKFHHAGGEPVDFIMEYEGKVINRMELDLEGIKKDELKRKKPEIMMHFFFSGVEDRLIELINEEHTDHILETVAVEFSK